MTFPIASPLFVVIRRHAGQASYHLLKPRQEKNHVIREYAMREGERIPENGPGHILERTPACRLTDRISASWPKNRPL